MEINLEKWQKNAEKNGKEFLYVGHYIDTNGNYMLKIGTTNELKRRQQEHERNYKKAKAHTMPKDGKFEYDFVLPLGKYNTTRYEDKNRENWQKKEIGTFVRNDRFVCKNKPKSVEITVKKTYKIDL